MLWVMCRASPLTLLIGVCYRPPRKSPDFPRKLHNVLNKLVSKHPKAHILLFGDFNYPNIDWSNQPQPIVSQEEPNDFIDVCLNFNLTQVVSEPTRVAGEAANTLDLILTTHPDSLNFITGLREISDHKVIHATFNFSPELRQTSQKTIRLYDKGNYEAINSEITNFLSVFETSYLSRSVNENWTLFKHKVIELTNKYIPSCSLRKSNQKPWFTKTLKRLENKKKRAFRTAKRHANPHAWEKYYEAENAYLAEIGSAKRSFFEVVLPKMIVDNPKKFWKVINPKESRAITLTNNAGEIVADSDCADIFNSAFSSVFTDESQAPCFTLPLIITTAMDAITFSSSGISCIIDKIKHSSAAGIDDINPKI